MFRRAILMSVAAVSMMAVEPAVAPWTPTSTADTEPTLTPEALLAHPRRITKRIPPALAAVHVAEAARATDAAVVTIDRDGIPDPVQARYALFIDGRWMVSAPISHYEADDMAKLSATTRARSDLAAAYMINTIAGGTALP